MNRKTIIAFVLAAVAIMAGLVFVAVDEAEKNAIAVKAFDAKKNLERQQAEERERYRQVKEETELKLAEAERQEKDAKEEAAAKAAQKKQLEMLKLAEPANNWMVEVMQSLGLDNYLRWSSISTRFEMAAHFGESNVRCTEAPTYYVCSVQTEIGPCPNAVTCKVDMNFYNDGTRAYSINYKRTYVDEETIFEMISFRFGRPYVQRQTFLGPYAKWDAGNNSDITLSRMADKIIIILSDHKHVEGE